MRWAFYWHVGCWRSGVGTHPRLWWATRRRGLGPGSLGWSGMSCTPPKPGGKPREREKHMRKILLATCAVLALSAGGAWAQASGSATAAGGAGGAGGASTASNPGGAGGDATNKNSGNNISGNTSSKSSAASSTGANSPNATTGGTALNSNGNIKTVASRSEE